MEPQIPIYIIGLRRLPERKLNIQRQLDFLGLKYRLVDVDFIDKYKLESQTYRAEIARLLSVGEAVLENKWRQIGSVNVRERFRGQFAMILNHIYVYNLMEENNHNIACILEDDATLLPTFPQILKIAPKRSWDILQLAHQPVSKVMPQLNSRARSSTGPFSKFGMFLTFLRCWLGSCSSIYQHAIRLYGFDHQFHAKQSKYIVGVLQAYYDEYKKFITALIGGIILKIIMPGKGSQYLVEWRSRYTVLNTHTSIQLGTPPQKNSLEVITDEHCIGEPSETPLSSTAYIIKRSAAIEWKQSALAENKLVIDQVPWKLYTEGRAKLRLICPPCVTATYNYLKYSARTG